MNWAAYLHKLHDYEPDRLEIKNILWRISSLNSQTPPAQFSAQVLVFQLHFATADGSMRGNRLISLSTACPPDANCEKVIPRAQPEGPRRSKHFVDRLLGHSTRKKEP